MANPNGVTSTLARIARELGAESIFIIRGAEHARLEFRLPISDAMAQELARSHGVEVGGVSVSVTPTLALPDQPLLMVLQFPQADGGAPGVETR